MARRLGAPVIEPPGKHASSRSTASRPGARRPVTVLTRWCTVAKLSSSQIRGAATLPGSQTRPKSLRSRSTIITFSARSLADAPSSARTRASSTGSARRRRVPLMGCVTASRAFHGHQPLGRAREDAAEGILEERAHGRRVGVVQVAVELPGVAAVGEAELAREVHLVRVAGADVVDDPRRARQVVLALQRGGDLALHAEGLAAGRLPREEAIADRGRLGVRERRERGERGALLRMVDDHRPGVEPEGGFRHERRRAGLFRRKLRRAASQLVAEVADGAAGDGPVRVARGGSLEKRAQAREGVLRDGRAGPVAKDLGAAVARDEAGRRPGREDVVAAAGARAVAAVQENGPAQRPQPLEPRVALGAARGGVVGKL